MEEEHRPDWVGLFTSPLGMQVTLDSNGVVFALRCCCKQLKGGLPFKKKSESNFDETDDFSAPADKYDPGAAALHAWLPAIFRSEQPPSGTWASYRSDCYMSMDEYRKCMCGLASTGRSKTMTWLWRRHRALLCLRSTSIVQTAARCGNIEAIRWCMAAADVIAKEIHELCNEDDKLFYLSKERECISVCPLILAQAAGACGHLDVVRWAMAQEKTMKSNARLIIFETAVSRGHVHVLEWIASEATRRGGWPNMCGVSPASVRSVCLKGAKVIYEEAKIKSINAFVDAYLQC